MSPTDTQSIKPGEPAWQIALLFPPQGSWSEADYFNLDAGRQIEFDEGCVEVLELPNKIHQRIVQHIYRMLFAYLQAHPVGEAFVAPLPVRLWNSKFREPDVVFVRHDRAEYVGYPDGADLVIEVVSDDATSRHRDLVIKRAEYARAGIAEYWIVDPIQSSVSVCVLQNNIYEMNEYKHDQLVASIHLQGFTISVQDIFSL